MVYRYYSFYHEANFTQPRASLFIQLFLSALYCLNEGLNNGLPLARYMGDVCGKSWAIFGACDAAMDVMAVALSSPMP